MASCLQCGKQFIRKHPSQKFCPKKGKRHICKDRFHNGRRFEAGEITVARQRFLSRGHHKPIGYDEEGAIYPVCVGMSEDDVQGAV